MELPPIQFNPDLDRGVIIDGIQSRLAFQGGNTFSCSFVGIDEGKYILVDPDEEEEDLATENMFVVIDQERRLRYLYKGGIGFTKDHIKKCIAIAGDRAGYLSFIIEDSGNKIQTSD
jgi:exosome complex RNA-binding protein Rrp42 (RNase PH superfamily)